MWKTAHKKNTITFQHTQNYFTKSKLHSSMAENWQYHNNFWCLHCCFHCTLTHLEVKWWKACLLIFTNKPSHPLTSTSHNKSPWLSPSQVRAQSCPLSPSKTGKIRPNIFSLWWGGKVCQTCVLLVMHTDNLRTGSWRCPGKIMILSWRHNK